MKIINSFQKHRYIIYVNGFASLNMNGEALIMRDNNFLDQAQNVGLNFIN